MNKFRLIIFFLVFVLSFFVISNVNATVTMNKKSSLSGIPTSVRTKKHLSGTPDTAVNKGAAYCFNKDKTSPSVGAKAQSLKDTVAKGKRLCVLFHGVTRGEDGGTQQFLETQIALWMIQEGKKDISIHYMNGTEGKYTPRAKKLYDKCKNESDFVVKASISISSIKSKLVNGNYELTATVNKSHVSNYKITSVSGVSGASYSKKDLTGDSFVVKVPEKNITKSTNVTIKLTGTGAKYYINIYDFGSKQPLGILLKKKDTDDASKSITLSPTYYTASISKQDEKQQPLEGAEFSLYKSSNCTGTVVGTKVTGKDGIAKFTNLLTGSYSFKETKAPEGYNVNNTCTTAKLNATVGPISNSKNDISISLTKIDSDNLPIKGAVFGIYTDNSCNTKYNNYTMTTNENGIASIDKIPSGTYYVKEESVPTGYDIDTTCRSTTELGKPIVNNKHYVKIHKRDAETKESLSCVKFNLYSDSSCSKLVGTSVTGDDGIAIFDKVSKGSYYYKEVEALPGYKIDDKCSNAITTDQTIEVDNKKSYGIKINKKDEDTLENIKNATFELYSDSSCNTLVNGVSSKSTDENGMIIFNNLDKGNYYVKEKGKLSGYIENTSCISAKLIDSTEVDIVGLNLDNDNNDLITKVFNKKEKYKAQVKKVDVEKKIIDNAVSTFGIHYNDSTCSENSLVEEKNTVNGIATFDELVDGNYYIQEKVAPSGYELNTECKKVNINNIIEVVDKKITYKASIIKKNSSSGLLLYNAEFWLYKDSECKGEVLDKKTTNLDGVATFEKLDKIPYYVKEAKAPEGYLLNDQCISLELNNSKVISNDPKPEEEKPTYDLSIKKVEKGSNNPIGGVQFTIYTDKNCAEGTSFATQVTDDNGIVTFTGLDNTTYYVKETETPIGYEANTSCRTVHIRTSDEDYNIIENVKINEIVIEKVDAGDVDVLLDGALFNLYEGSDCSGKIVNSGKTVNGQLRFGNLQGTNYSIKEIEAPKNYKLPDESKACIKYEDHLEDEIITISNEKYKSISIKKVDSINDGVLLKGATFNLYKGPGCSGEVYKVSDKTNDNGIVTFTNIPEGTYSIKENTPTEGYSLNSKCFDADEGDTVTVSNEKNRSIKITKTDYDNKSAFINGATFELYNNLDCSGSPMASESTKLNGIILFDNLTPGNYSIKEVKAPAGYYDISDKCKGIELSGNADINISNEKIICEKINDKYYDNEGKEVTEEVFNSVCHADCFVKCHEFDGKYYDDKGKVVSQNVFYERCNDKCKHVDDKYYNNIGKPVSYDDYKKDCDLKCTSKDGKYYNDNYEEVSETEYKKACDRTCVSHDGNYYNSKGELVSEEDYAKECAPKCEIKNNDYYLNGVKVDESTYNKNCNPICEVVNGVYYNNKREKVESKEEFEDACNRKCIFAENNYYNDKGEIVDQIKFNESCNPKCCSVNGRYYDKKGNDSSIEDYYKSCNPSCKKVGNDYYDPSGKPVSKEEYDKACGPKCEISDGKYYNNEGSIISKEDFYKICNPKCKSENGNYYDRSGKPVSEKEYNKICNPKCKIVGKTRYGKNGNIVSKSTYNSECGKKNFALPDTASPLKIIITVLGIILLLIPVGFVLKDYVLKNRKG